MAEDPPEDRAWLLEPPGSGEVHVHVQTGEGVELDETQRAALESLVRSFYEGEVSGHAWSGPGPEDTCTPYVECRPQFSDPCLAHTCYLTNCKICAGAAPRFQMR